jgi:hypothetical protein
MHCAGHGRTGVLGGCRAAEGLVWMIRKSLEELGVYGGEEGIRTLDTALDRITV